MVEIWRHEFVTINSRGYQTMYQSFFPSALTELEPKSKDEREVFTLNV